MGPVLYTFLVVTYVFVICNYFSISLIFEGNVVSLPLKWLLWQATNVGLGWKRQH